MTTLIGGEDIEVTHLQAETFDESSRKRLAKFQPLFGTTELVKVRQVPLSLMPPFANAVLYNDEAAAIEIYCGKERGWADTLDPASVNALADKGLEINLPFFGAWYQRQAKWKEKQTPGSVVALQKKLAELETKISASLSPASSAPSPTTTV